MWNVRTDTNAYAYPYVNDGVVLIVFERTY
jgi:hypothetical protein